MARIGCWIGWRSLYRNRPGIRAPGWELRISKSPKSAGRAASPGREGRKDMLYLCRSRYWTLFTCFSRLRQAPQRGQSERDQLLPVIHLHAWAQSWLRLPRQFLLAGTGLRLGQNPGHSALRTALRVTYSEAWMKRFSAQFLISFALSMAPVQAAISLSDRKSTRLNSSH